ncbi:hypothetical protein AMTR_s00001p00269290 [Amborella trichopoda]|uniref:Uncharacterized protein n=1 Tax=Amborella trichopoda TaxID=13333 RepID=W1NMP3_AMBTC|nr:hypothetical protein AMTR_s00001p00269290 [Amborella trichopoda]
MEDEASCEQEKQKEAMAEQHKRPVVLLKDPIMPSLEKALQLHFDLLKPWDSGQPLHSFLVSHAHLVSAVLCRGS